MESKQVTIGFKVSKELKKKIIEVADRMNLDVSSYLRSMLLDKHKRINYFCKYPNELLIDSEYILKIQEVLNELKEKNGNVSNSRLLLAALKVARDNEGRVISNKIKNYI